MSKYSFAPATRNESIIHGARRPGYVSDDPGEDSIQAWIGYMKQEGMEGVCSLLSEEELHQYPGLLDKYRSAFGGDWVCHVPIPDYSRVSHNQFYDDLIPFFEKADRNRRPIVVHCSAGKGRTGHVLALWLVYARGFTLDEALQAVSAMGRSPLEALSVNALGRILKRAQNRR